MRNGNQIGVCLAGCIFMAWVCAASGQATRTWDNGVGTRRYAKAILVGALILVGLAVWGITRVVINDNPVKWFNDKHPIRIADRVMNSHFGGTYMGYLSLSPSDELPGPGKLASEVEVTLQARQAELASDAMTGVAFAQVLSYLKSTGLKRGLLINFGVSKLSTGIRRVSL